MKNKFIRLHTSENNNVVIVNIDSISIVDSNNKDNRNCSTIYTDAGTNMEEFTVNESVEKIYSLLENKNKFIRLHTSETNNIIIVNIDYISIIDSNTKDGKNRSTIYTDSRTNMEEFTVNESAERIYITIEELYKEES